MLFSSGRRSSRRTSRGLRAAALSLAALSALAGCSKDSEGPPRLEPFDAGFIVTGDTGARPDAQGTRGDATLSPEAGLEDGSTCDFGADASEPADTGASTDAEPLDAIVPPDTGMPDVGFRDAAFLDARPRDASLADADPPDAPTGADAAPDGGTLGTDAATACTGTIGGTDRCTICGEQSCCPELMACRASSVCSAEFNGCFARCTLTDPVSICMARCFATRQGAALRSCVTTRCTPPCT